MVTAGELPDFWGTRLFAKSLQHFPAESGRNAFPAKIRPLPVMENANARGATGVG
jgi:hypothetical protein